MEGYLTDPKKAYATQKKGAKRRGIGWELTFEQWLEWWGPDLQRRGSGTDRLQMQRFADTGPYALGNIRKGFPRDNGKTCGHMRRKRSSEAARAALERARDLDPGTLESPDELGDSDEIFAATQQHKVNLWEPRS